MRDVHPVAAAGFGAAADVYERARPSYPQEAVQWIVARTGLGAGRTVVDVGAGTGKLTRLLVPSGARVIAVEPVAEMRAQLERVVPEAESLDGTAEAIPLPDGSVDVITVAQAFHWFDRDAALPEFARVLAPDGFLVLIWNSRNMDDPLQANVERLLEPLRRTVVFEQAVEWKPDVERSPFFGRIGTRRFANAQSMTVEDVVDRVSSTSFVAAMERAERVELLDRVRALLADMPEPIELPYVTDVHTIPRTSDHPSNGRGTSREG